MKAAIIESKRRLNIVDIKKPKVKEDEVLLRVLSCGVCHTDLHIYRKEIAARLPVIPGHQIVGRVVDAGSNVDLKIDTLVGVGWLAKTCGKCKYCKEGRENLCPHATFNGKDVSGGYAEFFLAHKDFVFVLPKGSDPLHLSPLLCGGIIGYRAFVLLGLKRPSNVGLFGFGSSAHQIIHVLQHYGHRVFVFTRNKERQRLAVELGACWAGTPYDKPDILLEGSIVFAPSGDIIKRALDLTAPGGRVVVNAIYATDIEKLSYQAIYYEKELTTVANYTREDAKEFIELSQKIGIETKITVYRLQDAENALLDLEAGKIVGSAVIDLR